MGSKSAEYKCLNQVISELKYQHGRSKSIISMFANKEVSRLDKERPDFIKYCPATSPTRKAVLLGIEHFQVDHFSILQKTGKIGATVNKYLREEENRKNIFDAERKHDGDLTDKAIATFAESVSQGLQIQYNADYYMYIESFRYSLQNHLAQVDTYLRNINEIAKGDCDVELAFLIEIYSSFKGTFLTSRGITKLTDDTFIPIFEDIVNLLENINSKKVKYVVLCFNSLTPNKRAKVISLSTNSLRKQLEKQHIQIYNYAGEHYAHKPVEVFPSFSREGDMINLEMAMPTCEISMEKQMEQIVPVFLNALTFKKNKKPYIATQQVQLMVELFEEYYIRCKNLRAEDAKHLWKLILKIDGDKIRRKMEYLEKIWYPQKTGERNE